MINKNRNYVKCPICSQDKYKVLYESTLKKEDYLIERIIVDYKNTLNSNKKHGRIVKCRNCDFIYTNPIENTKEIMTAYSKVEDDDYLLYENFRKILSKNHLKSIEKYKKEGKILDIGCFAGFFLELAKKNGWKIYGLEPSLWASKIAKDKGVNIIGNDIEKIQNNENYFDAITMWDVIEHLANPQDVVRKCYSSLVKGGIIAVGTPNIDSFVSKLLKTHNPYLIRMHLGYYSPKTLERLLVNEGFEILEVHSYGRTYPISYFLDSLKINNRYFTYLKNKIKSLGFISNYPIHLNLRDSFVMIAKK